MSKPTVKFQSKWGGMVSKTCFESMLVSKYTVPHPSGIRSGIFSDGNDFFTDALFGLNSAKKSINSSAVVLHNKLVTNNDPLAMNRDWKFDGSCSQSLFPPSSSNGSTLEQQSTLGLRVISRFGAGGCWRMNDKHSSSSLQSTSFHTNVGVL